VRNRRVVDLRLRGNAYRGSRYMVDSSLRCYGLLPSRVIILPNGPNGTRVIFLLQSRPLEKQFEPFVRHLSIATTLSLDGYGYSIKKVLGRRLNKLSSSVRNDINKLYIFIYGTSLPPSSLLLNWRIYFNDNYCNKLAFNLNSTTKLKEFYLRKRYIFHDELMQVIRFLYK